MRMQAAAGAALAKRRPLLLQESENNVLTN
jgi:hypothetical protein